MNFLTIIFTLFFTFSAAKIAVSEPETNVTAAKAFNTLFLRVPVKRVSSCGDKLLSTASTARADYEACIKSLKTPKIFEDKFLALNAKDFDTDGIVFLGTMRAILAAVSREIGTTCSKLDPEALDQTAYDEILNENFVASGPIEPSNLPSDPSTQSSTDSTASTKGGSNGYIYILVAGAGMLVGALLSYLYFVKFARKHSVESYDSV